MTSKAFELAQLGDAVTVDGSNVGIGTSSPSEELHLAASLPTIRLEDTDNNYYSHVYSQNGDLILSSDQGNANAGSALRFEVDTTERMRIDSSGNIIHTGGSNGYIQASGTDNAYLRVSGASINEKHLDFYSGTTKQFEIFLDGSQNFIFRASPSSERMRIDSSGNLLVGTTQTFPAFNNVVGCEVGGFGQISASRNGAEAMQLNRKTSDGDIALFKKDGSTVGSIGCRSSGTALQIYTSNTGLDFAGDGILPMVGSTITDNSRDIGSSSYRWDDIYATNGTIQTSDRNEKQQIAPLTSAEITAAKAISQLFKTYKWNSSVESKGDNARTHTGVIAQEVEAAMSDAGLDAGNYAFFISTTWWETSTEVPAVEADEENGIEAQDAYTSIETYNTQEEAPEGAIECNRKGIRYPELLSFIGAATEQRLTSIEARLDALEAE